MIERRKKTASEYARANFKQWAYSVVSLVLIVGFIYFEILGGKFHSSFMGWWLS